MLSGVANFLSTEYRFNLESKRITLPDNVTISGWSDQHIVKGSFEAKKVILGKEILSKGPVVFWKDDIKDIERALASRGVMPVSDSSYRAETQSSTRFVSSQQFYPLLDDSLVVGLWWGKYLSDEPALIIVIFESCTEGKCKGQFLKKNNNLSLINTYYDGGGFVRADFTGLRRENTIMGEVILPQLPFIESNLAFSLSCFKIKAGQTHIIMEGSIDNMPIVLWKQK